MAGDADGVGFLKGVAADQVGRDLTGDDDQRYRVEECIGYAGHRVCSAGARCDQHHAGFTGRAGIAFGGMGSTCLVPDEDMFDLRMLEQRVVNWQNCAARIAEYDIHALFDQGLDQYVCTGFFGHFWVQFDVCEVAAQRGFSGHAALQYDWQERVR